MIVRFELCLAMVGLIKISLRHRVEPNSRERQPQRPFEEGAPAGRERDAGYAAAVAPGIMKALAVSVAPAPEGGPVSMEMRPVQRSHDATSLAELQTAIMEFEKTLPGWWYSLGICSVSRDASCGPDSKGPDAALLKMRKFDSGFHCDDHHPDSTMADALRNVMGQALEAKTRISEMGSVADHSTVMLLRRSVQITGLLRANNRSAGQFAGNLFPRVRLGTSNLNSFCQLL